MIGLSRMSTIWALWPRSARISVVSRARIRFTAALLGLISSLLAVAADVEPQKIHPVLEVHDTGLVLVEDQTPRSQPLREPRLDLLGVFPRVAQGQQIIGVSDQNRGARPRRFGVGAGADIADSGGLFHSVQGNDQQRADHPALWAAVLGRCEPTLIDHPRA